MSKIEVVHFSAYKTFDGLCSVDSDFNPAEWALNHAIANVERLWGKNRPIHFVVPTDESLKNGYTLSAWLHGPARNTDEDATHLIVVWFARELPSDILGEVMRVVAWGHRDQEHGWESLARGFDY